MESHFREEGEVMPSAVGHSLDTSELIKRFQVRWDVWPEYIFLDHEKRQIGFQLELAGMHEDGSENPEPGSRKCRETYQALVQIAKDVLPPGNDDDNIYRFEPYDPGIHYSPRHGNRPEVVLNIRIVHRKAFDRPVDDGQVRYLDKLQQRLEEKGIGQNG